MQTPEKKDNLKLRRIAGGLRKQVTVLVMSLLSVTSFQAIGHAQNNQESTMNSTAVITHLRDDLCQPCAHSGRVQRSFLIPQDSVRFDCNIPQTQNSNTQTSSRCSIYGRRTNFLMMNRYRKLISQRARRTSW